MKTKIISLSVFLFLPFSAVAGDLFSLTVKGTLTTTSQLFPNPNASDDLERSRSIELENSFGGAVELRYFFPESNLSVALAGEYLAASTSFTSRVSGRSITVKDGYRVYPIEATLYFTIPISSDPFQIYIGGGGGMYWGTRSYSVDGINVPNINSTTGFGIHVLAGFSYRITELIGGIAEMKFRDLQFEALNAVRGQDPIASRIHTDGIVFLVGTAFYIL